MLSQKTRYTIRALQHLADRYQQGPVRLDEIATAQNIPRKFLTVILSELAREGIVVSHRGRAGGYELALPPVDVRYGDIIRITRGSLALVPCASRNAHETCANCLPEAECRLRGLMLLLRDEMATMLDRMSLADAIVCDRHLRRGHAFGPSRPLRSGNLYHSSWRDKLSLGRTQHELTLSIG